MKPEGWKKIIHIELVGEEKATNTNFVLHYEIKNKGSVRTTYFYPRLYLFFCWKNNER